jgi:hypothetical protein
LLSEKEAIEMLIFPGEGSPEMSTFILGSLQESGNAFGASIYAVSLSNKTAISHLVIPEKDIPKIALIYFKADSRILKRH